MQRRLPDSYGPVREAGCRITPASTALFTFLDRACAVASPAGSRVRRDAFVGATYNQGLVSAPRLFMLLSSLALAAPAQTTILTWSGPAASAWMGASVAAPGDLNADGVPELVVGVPGPPPTQPTTVAGCVIAYSAYDGAILWQTCGGTVGERFGSSVAAAGDLDGDGISEVVVAAPGAGGVPGVTRILSGAGGGVFRTLGFASSSVDGGRDYDGDGVPDQLAAGFGTVKVFSGATGSALLTVTTGAYGFTSSPDSAAFIHDVHGDGFDDVIVGSSWSFSFSGRAVLVRGPNGVLGGALQGTSGLFFGASVHDVGDANGDGWHDVGVGTAPTFPGLPELRVYDSTNAALLWSVFVSPKAGGVARIGDLDADGRTDVVVAPASVLSGSNGATILSVPLGVDGYLASVAALGDATGDGVPEFACGAPLADVAFPDGGWTAVVSCAQLRAASVTNLGGSCGAFATSLAASPFVLGAPSAVTVAGAMPSAAATLALDVGPDVATPYGGCTWHLDLASAGSWVLMPMPLDAAGSATLTLAVPSVPSATGLVVPLQLVVWGTSSAAGFDLSNGLRAIAGF